MSRSQRVYNKLLKLQEEGGGRLSWRDFMSFALHDEEIGYYVRGVQEIGREGDFSTFATHAAVGRLLARGIKNWIYESRREYFRMPTVPICELGPGAGELARGVLQEMGWRGWVEQLNFVERSKPLQQLQRVRCRLRRVRWFPTIEDFLHQSGGKGIVYSNEFVDAFPCSLWQWTEGGWREVGLRIQGEQIQELLLDREELPPSTAFRLKLFSVGQRLEVHESFQEWMEKWSSLAKKCVFLIIDYGAEVGELYERRPRGTLRGYFRHERIEWPEVCYRVGQQDLTADVNFSDLQQWARELGWEVRQFRKLDEFLCRYLQGQKLHLGEQLEAGLRAFCVLELAKHGS